MVSVAGFSTFHAQGIKAPVKRQTKIQGAQNKIPQKKSELNQLQ